MRVVTQNACMCWLSPVPQADSDVACTLLVLYVAACTCFGALFDKLAATQDGCFSYQSLLSSTAENRSLSVPVLSCVTDITALLGVQGSGNSACLQPCDVTCSRCAVTCHRWNLPNSTRLPLETLFEIALSRGCGAPVVGIDCEHQLPLQESGNQQIPDTL